MDSGNHFVVKPRGRRHPCQVQRILVDTQATPIASTAIRNIPISPAAATALLSATSLPAPPYSQPPAYQPPPYQQPAQPPKKGGGGRVFLIIGIVLAVLIIACVGLCAALGLGARIAGTAIGTKASQLGTQAATQFGSAEVLLTVTTFCQAESSQDYTSAYQQLSPALQQQFSQSQFTTDNQNHDSTLGPVSTCAPTGGATLSGSTASVTIAVTRTPPTPTTGTSPSAPHAGSGQITMIQDSNGNWVINSVDSSLDLL